jgi:Carboxypeptidase regulatory-like domain
MDKRFLVVAHLIIISLGLVSATLPIFAQADFGAVTDPSGAAVSKANVTVINQSKGATEQTTTNERGNYSMTPLIPDVYTLRVEAQRFRTIEFRDIAVSADRDSRVDARFQVGSTKPQVEVTADAPEFKTKRADLSAEFGQRYVEDPRGTNRNLVWFELLPPATATQKCWSHALPENPQGGQQIFVDPEELSATDDELDGASKQDPVLGIILSTQTGLVKETKIGPATGRHSGIATQ